MSNWHNLVERELIDKNIIRKKDSQTFRLKTKARRVAHYAPTSPLVFSCWTHLRHALSKFRSSALRTISKRASSTPGSGPELVRTVYSCACPQAAYENHIRAKFPSKAQCLPASRSSTDRHRSLLAHCQRRRIRPQPCPSYPANFAVPVPTLIPPAPENIDP